MRDGVLNWQDLFAQGQVRLERAGIDEAPVKLRWVAGHLLSCGLLDVLNHFSETPVPALAAAFEAAVARLERDEPVQYVIGETDFMGLRIHCDARALIPRPETELLVEHAEAYLRSRTGSAMVVDVCTGTGCIACALAKRMPGLRVLATEISPAALELAQANARALDVDVKFVQADLLSGVADDSVDLVVSNPPYVGTAECQRLPRTVRDFEPRLALDGGPDGLALISRLVSEAARVLTSGGQFMLEIGDDQAEAVTEILCQTTHLHFKTLISDCAGLARVVISERKNR